MAQLDTVLQHIRDLVSAKNGDTPGDLELLDRFRTQKDPLAFAVLLKRHGPMVLAVCRHVLQHHQDAEDAFQATFLILARQASTIRKQQALASWLHGVAYRIAMNAKRSAARRRKHESRTGLPPVRATGGTPVPPPSPDPAWELSWREVQPILDEEIERLPSKYRAVFVLCCLEGLGRAEAGRQLGLKDGTVSSRLHEARRRLQQRLARRGVVLSSVLGAAAISDHASAAVVSPLLVNSTVRAAQSLAAGEIGTAQVVSANVAALVEGAGKALIMTKLRIGTALLLAAGALAGGVGLAAHQLSIDFRSLEDFGSLPRQEAAKPAEAAQPIAVADKQKPARTDLYGDPLPEGAIARIGSIQWRHTGLTCFAFLESGKFALTAGMDRTLRTWEVATGKLVRSVRLQTPPGYGWPLALSPDGKTLVGHDGAGKLVFWATETGKEIKSIATAGVGHLQFSPDSRILAAETGNGRVSLWDWQKGKELALSGPAQESLDSTFHTCFSQDSRWIAVGVWWMQPLRVYETATGRELHQFDCHAMLSTFSPDGKRLAIVSQGVGAGIRPKEVRLIELSSGKELARLPLGTEDFFESLNFSPDGKMLACGAYSQSCLVDLIKGEVRHRWPGLGRLAFASDGRVVAGKVASRLRFFDTGSGKEIHDRPSSFNGMYEAVDQIAVSPNGRRLASASQRECAVYVWDTASGKLIQRLSLSREKSSSLEGLAFAPDGRTLLVGRPKGQVEFWDSIDAKELRTISLQDPVPFEEEKGFRYFLLHATANGKHFCTIERCIGRESYFCKRLAIWESATGKLVRDYSTRPEKWVCSWPPDGLALALPTEDGLELRDVDSGRLRFNIKGGSQGGIVAASPDQRLIAVLGTKEMGRPSLGMIKKGTVDIWEAATGQEIASLPAAPAANLALAAGGRCLVTTDEAFLRVWDLATGKERRRWPLPSGAVDSWGTSIVSNLFTLPDGRRVVTTLYDGTALVWDLSAALDSLEPLAPNPGDNDIAAWWADLAGDDARRAYAAVWRLAEARRSAIAFLTEHLRPTPEADAQQIRQHIRDLDSDSFALRERAFNKLESLGGAARPALREALQKDPPPEVRRRVERLLEDRPRGRPAPDVLRCLRALHALELIDSEDARGLIARIAGGAGYAVETQEAKAALDRLNRRPTKK